MLVRVTQYPPPASPAGRSWYWTGATTAGACCALNHVWPGASFHAATGALTTMGAATGVATCSALTTGAATGTRGTQRSWRALAPGGWLASYPMLSPAWTGAEQPPHGDRKRADMARQPGA